MCLTLFLNPFWIHPLFGVYGGVILVGDFVFFLQYVARMARATRIMSEGTKEQRHMMSAGTGFLALNKAGKHSEK